MTIARPRAAVPRFCYAGGMLRLPPALAVALSLLLILAQQAAGGHMLGHLGEMLARGEVEAQQGAGEQDDDKLKLSHACSACIAAAALAFAVPAQALPPLASGGAHWAPGGAPRAAPLAVDPPSYLARAPPAVS